MHVSSINKYQKHGANIHTHYTNGMLMLMSIHTRARIVHDDEIRILKKHKNGFENAYVYVINVI